MDWTFVYMMFVLKIPIVALFAIVWWAIRATPEEASVLDTGDGGTKTPRHPRAPLMPHPRRGPHGGTSVAAPPPRTRGVVARSRDVDHA